MTGGILIFATPSRGQMVWDIITSVSLIFLTRQLLTALCGAEHRVKNCNRRLKNAWPANKFVFTTQIVARIQSATSILALHGMNIKYVVRHRQSVKPRGHVGGRSVTAIFSVMLATYRFIEDC